MRPVEKSVWNYRYKCSTHSVPLCRPYLNVGDARSEGIKECYFLLLRI